MFESEDPESTLSGSETQETRPGWPPDDMCADSTRHKGSFDDRDREGLWLLSPLFQKKVLKLQRDLEEAKAESRYFRARQVDSPVIATNRPWFTTTPVPRYDGVSDWDQYREVFKAIVCSMCAECGFVGTRGPTQMPRSVGGNVIGTIHFPR